MIVGIDLGTTNSLIGAYTDEGPRLFPNALGDLLTPSAVSLDDGGAIIVGQAARDRLVSHPHASVASFKRWMGTSRHTLLSGKQFRPEELSALLLRALVADAEAALGHKVEEAVISVPAYFSDAQRKATRTAGHLAGLRVERLINEPTAAALAYGLQERREGGRFLVVDLGGGTFDVSVLELFEGVVEVHATAGDNFLGGEDFLDLLVHACCTDLALDSRTLPSSELAQLRGRIERVKRELSSKPTAGAELRIGGEVRSWAIDDGRYAQLAEPLMQRMRMPLERAMRDARLAPSDLDEIILVGGASRMPLVSRLAARVFGRLPLRHVSPDHAIALGATIAAGLKARDQRLEEVILTDVCPYTLGTAITRRDHDNQVESGYFHPIIHRNSTVPVSREDRFFPAQERQRALKLEIYQGENPMVARNIKLGELDIDLPANRRADQNSVLVRFTYDINGVLQVEATLESTGERHELVLQQNPGVLTLQEIRSRLATLSELKIHPRDKQENIAVLARAERLYEEHLLAREQLQQWIVTFRRILESQDLGEIAEERKNLSAALDRLDG